MKTELPGARRRGWVMPLARRYADYRLARAFEGVFVSGLDAARAEAGRAPILIAANHVAWWDPLLATALDARLGTEGFAVMDAGSLAKLPFFAAIGALPLRRARPREAREDLLRAASLLDRPGRAVWIFPQGRQRPSHLRPLGLSRGVCALAEASGACVLPLSISYLYREAPEPAIFASFGAPIRTGRWRDRLAALEASLLDGLDGNDAFATKGLGTHLPLWRPRGEARIPLGGRLLLAGRAAIGERNA